jgi:hypothetical protein
MLDTSLRQIRVRFRMESAPIDPHLSEIAERFWVYQIVDERTDSPDRVLPRYSVPPPTPGLWDRASSWMTRPRTSESFSLRWLVS